MVWLPADRLDVETEAVPLASVPVPKLTPPSRKVTVPPGVPTAGLEAVTVAVKVVDWPNTVGFTEEETVVTVFRLTTNCAMPVFHAPAPPAVLNSFSDQKVLPSDGSTPVPL